MTKAEAIEQAIARKVSHGQNEENARKHFAAEILADVHWQTVDGIVYMLLHFDYATIGQAPAMAAALKKGV